MSSSSSDDSKDTTNTTNPPKHEPFFDAVRRLTDLQFSTVLHSLIGLPSSLSPPATSGWIVDDDDDDDHHLVDSAHPPPPPLRSGSDSIVDKVRKLLNNDGNDGKGGGVGSLHQQSATAPGAAGEGSVGKREAIGFAEFFGFPSPLDVLRTAEEAHEEIFRALAQAAAATPPLPANAETTATELDYYSFFEHQFRQQAPSQHSNPRRVVESYSETRSVIGVDGITKTRRVEVKKYADGTEERMEREGVVLPESTNTRVTEV